MDKVYSMYVHSQCSKGEELVCTGNDSRYATNAMRSSNYVSYYNAKDT